jgi:hypothetical protein
MVVLNSLAFARYDHTILMYFFRKVKRERGKNRLFQESFRVKIQILFEIPGKLYNPEKKWYTTQNKDSLPQSKGHVI